MQQLRLINNSDQLNMFRAIISHILRSTRLRLQLVVKCTDDVASRQHRGCIKPQVVNTQSSAPEDGQNNFPKHVELIGIINIPLLLHLVVCLYY